MFKKTSLFPRDGFPKVNKVYRGDVTADLYQNNLSLVIDIVNIVISIPAAEQTDEILVGFLLVKTS